MSGKLRGNNVKWESSTDEDEPYESNYKMGLRESLRNIQQSSLSGNETVVESRRRGRGPAKRPCLNRNALMARENRQRKKAYLEKIENKLSFYQQENKNLVNVIRKQNINIKRLSSEVAYLRSVLNNNTSITSLLKTINDGLRKINSQKNGSFHSNIGCQCSDKLNSQQKCTCYTNAKGNVLNSQNTNIFITNVNADPLGDGATENQSSEGFVSTRSQTTFDAKNNLENKNTTNTITTTTSSISEDSYMDSTKDLDSLLPVTQADSLIVDEKKDLDATGINFDQLSTFNMDIFEDLPKCDEMMNTVDGLNDVTNLFTEEEISQSLDNTGICLHVNSDKVSLEFCSICHLNSKNLGSN